MKIPKTDMTRDLGVQLGEKLTLDRQPTEIDVTDGTEIYMRWTGGADPEIIVLYQLDGTVWSVGKRVGLWADRVTSTYEPIVMGG